MSFRGRICLAATLAALSFAGRLHADDAQIGATFVCNGKRLYVES